MNLVALGECLGCASSSIRAHGLRSFLTMLGIVIGVSSVVCVVALVQGLSGSITRQFQGLGGDTLTVRADTPFEDMLRGKHNRLKTSDLDQLRYKVEGIRNVTPVVLASAPGASEVRNGANVTTGQLFGTTAHYQDVQQAFPRFGRFLTDSDDASRRRVVVLGDKMRRDLKLPDDPTGRFIQVGGEWFKVVGSMEARGEMFGLSQDNYLLMPYRTALALTGAADQPDLWISFSVADLDRVESVKARVAALLRRWHRLGGAQADDFRVESSDTLAKSFRQVSTTITLVVAGIVGISLLVGGVGIMNIMLVSVTERTREIGIAKALGARRSFILMQFLVEAVLLAAIGGLLGIALGYVLGFGVAGLIPNFPRPAVPWWAIAGAFLFSTMIGVVFGVLPASKAANMAPAEALRCE